MISCLSQITRLIGSAVCVGSLLVVVAGANGSAGSLLIDLDARDFQNGAGKWPQREGDTAIRGDFAAKGSPTRQVVGGVDAVVFDGDGDYFVGPLTTAALHAAGASHSVEVWAYQGNVREQESLVSWGKRLGPNRSFAGFRYGADPDFGAIARWAEAESGFTKVPSPGVWHYLAFSYDGDVQSVYVDGKLDNARPVGELDAHDMLPIHLGAELSGNLKLEGQFTHFSGAMARVKIRSGALDAEQVKRTYEAEKGGFPGRLPRPLLKSPVHRFSFDKRAGDAPDGTTITDSIGGLTAVVRGAGAKFTGRCIELPGGSSATAAYLDFPNRLISARENVSIEFWEAQTSMELWSRILSIGTNTVGEITVSGGTFTGTETLTLFGNVGAANVNRFARSNGIFPNGGPDRNPAEYPESELGQEFQQVITYDKSLQEWHWYRNGILMEVVPDERGSALLDDVNVWLGRSEFSSDSNFRGRIREFRIYSHALSEDEIYGNLLAGPGAINIDSNGVAMHWTPLDAGKFSYWNKDGANSWKSGPNGPSPDGKGRIAVIASDLRGDQEISINKPLTLGSLSLGSRSRSGAFRLTTDGGGSLTMDSGTAIPAAVFQSSGSLENTLDLPLVLAGPTEISNSSESPLIIAGDIGGVGPLVKSGSGALILVGDGRDFSGGTEVVGGSLLLGDGSESGTLGSSHFKIMEPGKLIFNRSDAVKLGAIHEGSGSIHQQGCGGLLLTAQGKIATSGELRVHAGSGAFTSDGMIAGPHALRVESDLILRGASKTRIADWVSVGIGHRGNLTMQDSASLEIEGSGHFNVGDLAAGQSVFRMEGGTARFREFFVGKRHGTSGVVLQSGGEMHKTGALLDARVGGVSAGESDSWGAWRLTGGSYQDDWNLQIGAYGVGVMEVAGGSAEIDGFLSIGRFEDNPEFPGNGVMDVRSGKISATSPERLLLVGEEGIGVLTIRGKGEVVCANRMVIGAGTMEKPGEGTVNLLTGGTLVTGGIGQYNQNEAMGRLNFDGGTLRAGNAAADFLIGIDQADVRPGGAHIDTAGMNVAIAQPLVAPRGNGVVRIPVISAGHGYLAPPLIQINGGGGNGATAFAELVDGEIRNVLITNPGVDYLSPPVVQILGGGSGTGLILGSPVLGANRSGGLVKSGKGTLTLEGDNTYAESTQVRQGALMLRGRLAGAVEVADGALLGGDGSIAGNLTLHPGSSLNADDVCNLEVRGDAGIRGDWMLQGASDESGCVTILGTLDLEGARLIIKDLALKNQSMVRVIARYGALHGKFSLDEELPAGHRIDYQYLGENQIALVATSADSDAE